MTKKKFNDEKQKERELKEEKETADAEMEEIAIEDEENQLEELENRVEQEAMDAAAVNDMICALEAEKEEFLEALKRERADFENYKKRNAALASTSYANGKADAALAILPVLDNFERALQTECADSAFFDGTSMIMRQMIEALKGLGVEEISAEGQFDPQFHNAVMQVEEEGYESGDVVEVFQKGYLHEGKVIRHAMVKVNK